MRLPRNAQLWLPSYVRWRLRRIRERAFEGLTHVFLCMCDHYEPGNGACDVATERLRVRRWAREFPVLARSFEDTDGRPVQHTFFYPAEQYRPEHLDQLAEICAAGLGEVEIHLHHDRDTSDNLRRTLTRFRDILANDHGLLGRNECGEPVYGFIHGNWALDNSRPDGRWCGVNDELTVLRETGCYADFTLPAAPGPAQTRRINSIYYAVDDPQRPKSHDDGIEARAGMPPPSNGLLMVQGPLLLDWGRRRFGFMPGLDTDAVDASPGYRPSVRRVRRWVNARIGVVGRPDWVFVKLHTHGAVERNADVLLGESMRQFHEHIQRDFNDGKHFAVHYVTARELANLVRAAEEGAAGAPGAYRNHRITPPALLRRAMTGNTC